MLLHNGTGVAVGVGLAVGVETARVKDKEQADISELVSRTVDGWHVPVASAEGGLDDPLE